MLGASASAASISGGMITPDNEHYAAYQAAAEQFFEKVRGDADCGVFAVNDQKADYRVAQCVLHDGARMCTVEMQGGVRCFYGPGVGRVTMAKPDFMPVAAAREGAGVEHDAKIPAFIMQWTFVGYDNEHIHPSIMYFAFQNPDGRWRFGLANKGGF